MQAVIERRAQRQACAGCSMLLRSAPGMKNHLTLLVLIAPLLLVSRSQPAGRPTTPWQRLVSAPVIAPRGDGWESAGTFNPAVIEHEGRIVMLYRAQDRNGTSRLGYASSTDGITFERRDE